MVCMRAVHKHVHALAYVLTYPWVRYIHAYIHTYVHAGQRLFVAARTSDMETMQQLVDSGLSVNFRDYCRDTALHWYDVCMHLCVYVCACVCVCVVFSTFMHKCCLSPVVRVKKFLTQYGADMRLRIHTYAHIYMHTGRHLRGNGGL